MRDQLKIIAMFLALPLFAMAQAGSTTAPDSHSTETGVNTIAGGVRVGASYTDNVSGSNGDRTGDYRYSINPDISWDLRTARLSSLLSYSPGLTISQNQAPARNQLSQSFGMDVSYRATARLTVGIKDRFTMTNNPFEDVSSRSQLPQFGPLVNPNQTVLTPFANRINEQAGIDVSYLLNEKTAAGVSGNYSLTSFRDVPHSSSTSPTLISGETIGGRAYLMRHATARHWIGLEYDYSNHQAYREFDSRTTAQSGLVFDQFTIRPNLRLAVFAGPEFTHIQDQLALNLFNFVVFLPVSRGGVSYAVGGNFDWSTERTDLVANYVHRAGDGGGVIGSVLLNQFGADLREHLSSHWSALFSGTYGRNDALSVTSSFAGTRTVTAGGGLAYQISPSVALDGQYFYTHQKRIGSAGSGLTDRNRVAISLQYHFQHPVRR